MTYAEWNDAIATRFFNASNSGKRVYLAVERELLAEIGGNANAPEEFIAAVRTAPDGISKDSALICKFAQRCRRQWRERGSPGMPPYIAYLALFVLAASTEGEYQNEGFQKRLHRLLGEEISSVPPRGFYGLWELWEDLEIWANEDQQGNLGIFSCPLAGAKPFVDQPCSQIVLTEDERKRLPEIFAAHDLDPSAPPAAETLAVLVVRSGSRRLQQKTLRRLARSGSVDEDFRASTIEAILEELREWNGTADDAGRSSEFHTLRINLRIFDQLSGRAESRLIVKDSESFDAERLLLGPERGSQTHCLSGFEAGWSGGLENADGSIIDAASLAWADGLRLVSDEFVFRFPARRVRVFKHGEFDGVPGLLEASRLDPHREFYVAADASAKASVDAWGRSAAEKWHEVTLRAGLPRGWTLFQGARANPGIAAPSEFPVLRTDPQVRILLTGGIKVRPVGRRYFDFAPPAVRVEGLSPSMTITVNDEARRTEAGDAVLSFDSASIPQQVIVKVMENGEQRCSAMFHTVSARELVWCGTSSTVGTSALGRLVNAMADPYAVGGLVFGFTPTAFASAPSRPAYLVGAKAGEIVSVPSEPLPTAWQPVWIIEHGRGKRRVIFCGGDASGCIPVVDGEADRRKIRDWKQVLWYDRRNLIGPSRGEAAALWAQFKRLAENVRP